MSDCKCGFGASIPGFGTPGATFIPKVTETDDAVQVSWENNRGLPNPEPVNIPRGRDGLSAYEVAKANGFEGTEAEWLESLEGPEGPVGPQGPQGAAGQAGAAGAKGDPGKSAYAYAQDGGYTGTEEEFAAKLAEEYPTPDWNAAEGEPGHMLNRTHWKVKGDLAVLDGDLTGREYVDANGDGSVFCVKMSEETLTLSDLIGQTMCMTMEGIDTETVLSEDDVADLSEMGFPGVGVLLDGGPIVMSLSADVFADGLTVTSGTWFSYFGSSDYVKSLSGLYEYTYHKIPKEYLPETVTITISQDADGNYVSDWTPEDFVSRWKDIKGGSVNLECIWVNGERLCFVNHKDSENAPSHALFVGYAADSVATQLGRVDGLIACSVYLFDGSVTWNSVGIKNPNSITFPNAKYGPLGLNYGLVTYDGSNGIVLAGLPNPYAVTVNGTTYNGSAAVDLTDVINSMIDTKIAAMSATE